MLLVWHFLFSSLLTKWKLGNFQTIWFSFQQKIKRRIPIINKQKRKKAKNSLVFFFFLSSKLIQLLSINMFCFCLALSNSKFEASVKVSTDTQHKITFSTNTTTNIFKLYYSYELENYLNVYFQQRKRLYIPLLFHYYFSHPLPHKPSLWTIICIGRYGCWL